MAKEEFEFFFIQQFFLLFCRYNSLVLRDPGALIDLLRPLMHHNPIHMLQFADHRHLLVPSSLTDVLKRDIVSDCLRQLQLYNHLDCRLLNHFAAWAPLSETQRDAMLLFFRKSMLLCTIENRHDVLLVSARTRGIPALSAEVSAVAASATYVALYFLPIRHIGIIPMMIARAVAVKFSGVQLVTRSGSDTLLVHRHHMAGSCCSVHLMHINDLQQSRITGVESLAMQIADTFSCVLCIASSDFGLFKFMVKCADETMDSCSFGSRFQSWALSAPPSRCWVQFRHNGADASELSASQAMCRNLHEIVAAGVGSLLWIVCHNLLRCLRAGLSVNDFFAPVCPIFVSHAWSDGTGEFVGRLKTAIEKQTLVSVWVDMQGIDQVKCLSVAFFMFLMMPCLVDRRRSSTL